MIPISFTVSLSMDSALIEIPRRVRYKRNINAIMTTAEMPSMIISDTEKVKPFTSTNGGVKNAGYA